MSRSSKVILARGIKLDNKYQNVLSYSESEMYNLVNTNKIAEDLDCSFIRDENSLVIGKPYGVCLQANYMAFQNPEYSTKWFFAFIEKVEYISDASTKIYFKVDEFSTWLDYWSVKQCFVIREHTMDDTIGANTMPEGLETGEYIDSGVVDIYDTGNFYICIGVSEVASDISVNPYVTTYSGIYSGLVYFVFDEPLGATNFIRGYDKLGKGDAISLIFMIPISMCGTLSWTIGTIEGITTKYAPIPYSDDATYLGTSANITPPVAIGTYTPKNKKLFTYPYCYFYLTNNVGTEVKYHYEDFISNTASFKTYGAITPGGSVKAIPINYKKLSDTSTSLNSYNYGIVGGKFPMCSWKTDPYTNWLTQNGVNIAGTTMDQQEASMTAGIGELILGLAMLGTGGLGGIGALAVLGGGLALGGASGIFNSMQTNYQKDMIPQQARGTTNSGDVTYSVGKCDIIAHKMTIREEYARSIDDFFTRFGYKTNRLKYPNQTGRTVFNYVEIGKSEIIGYPTLENKSVPAESMEIINNIYRSGVTIWHDHANIGNYSLSNTIVS